MWEPRGCRQSRFGFRAACSAPTSCPRAQCRRALCCSWVPRLYRRTGRPIVIAKPFPVAGQGLVVDVLERRPDPIRQVFGRNVKCGQAIEYGGAVLLHRDGVIPAALCVIDPPPLSLNLFCRLWETDFDAVIEHLQLTIEIVEFRVSDEFVGVRLASSRSVAVERQAGRTRVRARVP